MMFSYYNEVRIIKYNQVKVSVFQFLPFKSYYVFIFLNNEVKAGVAASVSASSHKTHRRLNISFILLKRISCSSAAGHSLRFGDVYYCLKI